MANSPSLVYCSLSTPDSHILYNVMDDSYHFSWVHLSDIHFNHGDVAQGLDQQLVLHELRSDIESFNKHNIPKPQAIFITGDIAFSGNVRKDVEYGNAHKWISALADAVNIKEDRIFVVPGNHDVQRNVAQHDKNAARLLESLRSGNEKIDNVLDHPDDRALLASRLKNYLEFANKTASTAPDELYWVRRFSLDTDLQIRVVGLNTAILCADDHDKGKIELGKTQLLESFLSTEIEDNEVVIVLSHHPFDWLRDHKAASDLTAKYAHIHLCGHIHETHNEQYRSGGGTDFVRIVSGAAHDIFPDNSLRFGYSFGSLVGEAGIKMSVRIWPRVWSQKNCDFRPDVENVPASGVFAQYDLGIKSSTKTKRRNIASNDAPPFQRDDFIYHLPSHPKLDANLAPVPCTIEQIHFTDAFHGTVTRIFDYFDTRQLSELSAHESAWEEAGEEIKKRQNRDKFSNSDLRKKRLDLYHKLVGEKLKTTLPNTLWLLVSGDTGTGKTTLVRQLAHAFSADIADLRDYSVSKPLDSIIHGGEEADSFNDYDDTGLRRPRILILDALDKMVPGATYQLMVTKLREIRAFARNYHIVVITARTAFFRTHREEHLPDSTHIKLLPLDYEQVLKLAKNAGVYIELNRALEQSASVRDLSTKPLLLQILIEMLRQGRDIIGFEDDEDLFAYVVDSWLSRDTADAILPSDVRLKCMQCLALHSLSTGGGPFSYSSIDDLIKRVLNPLSSEEIESFNTDLRVCGFLRRLDRDVFEFQHAAFYEYCIARSVFEDLKHNDFIVVSSHPFTEEILQFIKTRARKSGRTNPLFASIQSAWKSDLGSVARVNLLKLCTAIEGDCHTLPLDNLIIEQQNLAGIKYVSSNNSVAHNTIFRECSFAGANFGRITAENWIFEKCSICDCNFGYARFHSCEIKDTHCRTQGGNIIRFNVCNWTGGLIETSSSALVTIEGGRLQNTILGSILEEHESPEVDRKQLTSSTIRLAQLETVNFAESAVTWRIEMCSVDELTLYEISNLSSDVRPSLSNDILRQVNAWKSNPGTVHSVIYPYVKSKRDVGKPIDQVLSKSQRRKIKRKILNALGSSPDVESNE